ncbi:FMN-dependent NADH-azoreductase [Roseateles amylovorans]|uniref:FMN dependent NADH:quinone oxidoreductase n=1 Tax=Roseateles amylovorans TaxID=2978473 RepID=A0ABY6AU42_9BURK|nr:NAD(P)H-dependent oxidoreductase [Roseateles amylovorans]UXH76739.1 NAD(P)H-dependent oxidoreductase [Roseateles amylovorans]
MTQLLVVETSPRGDHSVSRQMTRRFISAWRAQHPQGSIVHRDLAETVLPFVTASWLQAYFTPPAHQSQAMKDELELSDELTAELLAADHLVIATPVYNYNVPAALKAWVDHIVRKGVTLGFDGQGLVTGKKATVLLASGGVYTEGSPIQNRDIAGQYLRLILGVLGFKDVTVVAGGGAKAVDLGEQTMDRFLDVLQPQLQFAAGVSGVPRG